MDHFLLDEDPLTDEFNIAVENGNGPRRAVLTVPLPASLDLTGEWDGEVQEADGRDWTSSGEPQFHPSIGEHDLLNTQINQLLL